MNNENPATHEMEERFLRTRLERYFEKSSPTWPMAVPLEFYIRIFELNQWPFTIDKIEEKAGWLARYTKFYLFKRLPVECQKELNSGNPYAPESNDIHILFERKVKDVVNYMTTVPDWKTFLKTFESEFGSEVLYLASIDYDIDTLFYSLFDFDSAYKKATNTPLRKKYDLRAYDLFIICVSGKILKEDVTAYENELDVCMKKSFIMPKHIPIVLKDWLTQVKINWDKKLSKEDERYIISLIEKLNFRTLDW